MSHLVWSNMFSVGVGQIDDQHKTLVQIADRLNEHIVAGDGKDVLAGILDDLIQYTVYHFATEEGLMERHGYALAAQHAAQHRQLVESVSALKARVDRGEAVLDRDVMVFLREWLVQHMMGADKDLGRDLNRLDVR